MLYFICVNLSYKKIWTQKLHMLFTVLSQVTILRSTCQIKPKMTDTKDSKILLVVNRQVGICVTLNLEMTHN